MNLYKLSDRNQGNDILHHENSQTIKKLEKKINKADIPKQKDKLIFNQPPIRHCASVKDISL